MIKVVKMDISRAGEGLYSIKVGGRYIRASPSRDLKSKGVPYHSAINALLMLPGEFFGKEIDITYSPRRTFRAPPNSDVVALVHLV